MTGEPPPPLPTGTDLAPLLALVERLRRPDGCPWDRKQTLRDLRAYLLEEAHEVAAAIDHGDRRELAGELGDLLFQVAFLLTLGQEEGAFEPQQVLAGIHRKMVERHPHVWGATPLPDADAVNAAWERQKAREKAGGASLLEGVARSLPALLAAYRMTQKAAGVGFDWAEPGQVMAKLREELEELEEALEQGSRAALEEEVGDLLFSAANLARKLDLDPEAALAAANEKFRTRFRAVEQGLSAAGKRLGEATLEEMDALWEAAKGKEPRRASRPPG
jgi:MazG family protein